MTLIGFDIDMDEMAPNSLLDEKYCGDACESLQVPDGTIDLVMARAVIEHLHDTPAFLRTANRALRDGGYLIATFANKNAPFAVFNRVLPQRISAWLLRQLVPGSSGVLGFRAFYDRASYREFSASLQEAGFDIEEAYASYFGSSYYRFFTPLFILSLAHDHVCYTIGNPRLASHFMFVARKKCATTDFSTAGMHRRTNISP